MTEIIITAIGAALVGGGLAGWVGFNIGHKDGHAAGYLVGWRDKQAVSGVAETLESGRPERGPDGRYVKRGGVMTALQETTP